MVDYLDAKQNVKLEINGNDLKIVGFKPGPVFQDILKELYDLKLDLKICTREDELRIAEQWRKEGRFFNAVAD